MAKTPRKKLDDECLRLVSLVARTRDRTCRNCGADTNLQGHHIISRQYKLSRYNPENLLTLCRSCHFPEHVNPEKFRDTILDIIGEKRYLELKKKYMITYKWTVTELKQIKNDLKAELKSLEGGERWITCRKKI